MINILRNVPEMAIRREEGLREDARETKCPTKCILENERSSGALRKSRIYTRGDSVKVSVELKKRFDESN